jgi:hypothetical protein
MAESLRNTAPENIWVWTTGGMIPMRENRIPCSQIRLGATLFITNPAWIETSVIPGLNIQRPATNYVNYGTVN